MRVDANRLGQLREAMPDVYEELLALRNVKARLWNALVWYGPTYRKKFTGRLAGLARTLADEARGENGDRTQMDATVEQMARDGWVNCESGR